MSLNEHSNNLPSTPTHSDPILYNSSVIEKLSKLGRTSHTMSSAKELLPSHLLTRFVTVNNTYVEMRYYSVLYVHPLIFINTTTASPLYFGQHKCNLVSESDAPMLCNFSSCAETSILADYLLL